MSAEQSAADHRHAPTVELELSALVLGAGPRSRADPDHVQLLTECDTVLPPILVHRRNMRVVDGVHRVLAARARGRTTITAQWFEGDERDAFLLAVQLNTIHGLPLTREDRKRAAVKILHSHPDMSDRAIAVLAGLGGRVVAGLRREHTAGVSEPRVGRDGRVRPASTAAGRTVAAEVIRDDPDASLREIARRAGISVGTARDVRRRLAEGRDPVPGADAQPAVPGPVGADAERADHVSVFNVLCNDPSFRLNEVGRLVLQQLHAQLRRIEDWRDLAPGVPPHGRAAVAEILARCADDLLRTAETLRTYDVPGVPAQVSGAQSRGNVGRVLTGGSDRRSQVRQQSVSHRGCLGVQPDQSWIATSWGTLACRCPRRTVTDRIPLCGPECSGWSGT
jgi:ParB-like chromosome segregation protein Spo0J